MRVGFRLRSPVGFALSLLIPSTPIFQKYFGVEGVAVYLATASLTLLLFVKHRDALAKRALKVTDKQIFWLAAVTFLVIFAAFIVIYPIADSGIVGGGSDGDDALNIATTELLHGRFPYYPKTYLNNPISPLPGALLLAIPFVLLGNAAYQSFFWLFLFFISMKSYLQDTRSALLLLWAIFLLSPGVVYALIIGNDYIANSLYVLLFILWLTSSISNPGHNGWKRGLAAILLGIGLSSRLNFVLLLPLVFSALLERAGWKEATKYTAVTFITFMVVTVPFYVYDPQGFSPLHTVNELGDFQTIIPFAGVTIPLVTGIIALILSFFQRVNGNLNILSRNCALVLAFPVFCGIILSMIQFGRVDFSFAFFGLFFLFFGAVAFWSDLF